MAPSPSPFDADLLYIIQDVLKINTHKKPLHPIPEALLNVGIDIWEDFYVQGPNDISTLTYLTRGNIRTNLAPTMVIRFISC